MIDDSYHAEEHKRSVRRFRSLRPIYQASELLAKEKEISFSRLGHGPQTEIQILVEYGAIILLANGTWKVEW